MATIRKRGQSWQAQVRMAGHSSNSRTFRHKADAESWARQLETDIERAPYGLDRGKLSSLTLVDLLIRYRDNITPRKRGADIERYRIARLQGHKLARLSLDRLTPGQIANYRDERLAQVGAQTVRHELNLIRHVLNIARHEWDVPPNARFVYAAGQVGRAPDGTVPDGIQAQTENAWKNVINVLKGAGMGVEDIVKISGLLVNTDDLPGYLAVNDRFLGDHRPASTLMVLKSLARPELLVEIDVVAAKA